MRRAPPPPQFWLGVSRRLARFFDQRTLVRCVVVGFVFRQVLGGSWRFLAVLGVAWALAGQKWEPQIDKTEASGGKNGARSKENEALGASGGLWGTSWLRACYFGATSEFGGPILVPFWGPFFAFSVPWAPLGGSVLVKRRFGGGSKMGSKTRAKTS